MQKLSRRKSKLVFETGETVRSYGTAPRDRDEAGKLIGKPRRTVVQREITIVAHERHIEVRLKGTQQTFMYTWRQVYQGAAKQAADAKIKAKAAARKSKSKR